MTVLAASTVDPASLEKTKSAIRHRIVANEGATVTDVESDWILVAIGRRPVTENIGLEQIAGLTMEKGFVVVDGHLRTGVHAIGGVVRATPWPTSPATRRSSRSRRLPDETSSRSGWTSCPVTFCRPEIASVGLSEAEAVAAGRSVRSAASLPRPRQGDDRR